jgi:hypothetical protein
VTWRYGWKHFFGHEEQIPQIQQSEDCVFFAIVRNPVDYFISFYRNPHHQPEERTKDLKTFLTSEFYSLYEPNHPKYGQEELGDRNFRTGLRYKNIFELRSVKCHFLKHTFPALTSNYHFIRYEDLKYHPDETLDRIRTIFNLERRVEFVEAIMSALHLRGSDSKYKVERKFVQADSQVIKARAIRESYQVEDEEIRQIIRENLDYRIENDMGYYPVI